MDQELASAVFARWHEGAPVAETTLYKAAEALGVNPADALLEARFYTMLDYDLAKMAADCSYRPDDGSLAIYAAAAGGSHDSLVKTASRYRLDEAELVFRKLAEQNWVPRLDLVKQALMAPAMADGAPGDQGASMMDPAAMGAPQNPNAVPEPGAQVQQAPQARFKPSPMAPVQTPPSAEGNLQELAEAAQNPQPGADMGMGGMGEPGGGMGPEAAPADAPPPMSPEEKIQQVDPSVDPQTMERWAPKLQEIEEQTGIQMNDPGQVQKFIAEMQKADQKTLDDAIKAIGQPQPFNKPTNPNSPVAKPPGGPQAAEAQQPAPQVPPTEEKVAHLHRLGGVALLRALRQ